MFGLGLVMTVIPANKDPWFHMFCKWIHEFKWLNSLDSVNKFGVSICVSHKITSFSRDDTYQWNRTSSDPVRQMSNSFKNRDNRQNMCIHAPYWNVLVERYQLWTSLTRVNWFRNVSLFAGSGLVRCAVHGVLLSHSWAGGRPTCKGPGPHT